MKIVFASSSTFGLPAIEAVTSRGELPVCVITQPDRPAGRGQRLHTNPVKRFAADNRVPLFQPQDINDRGAVRKLRALEPDLIVVIAYGQKLSSQVLEIPRCGAINLHASLLPKYRGAAPINWAIIRGETSTGLSVIQMAERMDAGDILAQRVVAIAEHETAGQLHDRLADLGADLIVDVIRDISLLHVEPRHQDESRASFAPRLKKSQGRINWEKPARELLNFIRGVTPWPGAFTFVKRRGTRATQRIVVDRAVPASHPTLKHAQPGRVLATDESGIRVATGHGALAITKLTPAGRRPMTVSAFLNGHVLRPGDFLSNNGS